MLLLSSIRVLLFCIFICEGLMFICSPRDSHESNTVDIPDITFHSFMFYILFLFFVVFTFVCILAV